MPDEKRHNLINLNPERYDQSGNPKVFPTFQNLTHGLQENILYVDGHGSSSYIRDQRKSKEGVKLDAEALSALIMSHPFYKDSLAVRIISCDSGNSNIETALESLASKVANYIKKPVQGASSWVYYSNQSNSIYPFNPRINNEGIAVPALNDKGEWVGFGFQHE